MKLSTPSSLLILVCATLLSTTPTVLAAGSNKVKGLKGSKVVQAPTERRLKKKKIKGPESRTCKVDSKRDEVKFECKTRSGGDSGSSKDDKKSSKDSSKESSSDSQIDETDIQDRGITITPDEIKDKIKYKVRTTKQGVEVKIEYKQEVKTDDTETKEETEFEVLFENLIEYVKAIDSDSESEAYDWDADEIVQVIPLNNWDAIPGITDDSEGVVSYFTATTLPTVVGGGTTSFNFTISRADVGERISANSMKIDVRIVNFPWTRSDSYIALMSTVQSKKRVDVSYDDEATVGGKSKKTEDVTISFAEGMDTLGFSTFGEYTWAEEAEAESSEQGDFNGTVMIGRRSDDGETSDNNTVILEATRETIQVIATSPPSLGNETFQGIAYSFVGEAAHVASEIYWDPEAGIGYETADSSSRASSLGLIGSLLGALLYMLL